MRKSSILFALTALLLTSCGGEEPSKASISSEQDSVVSEEFSVEFDDPEDTDPKYEFQFRASLAEDEDGNAIDLSRKLSYMDSYFDAPSEQFQKKLALVSFAFVVAAQTKAQTESFFDTIGFDNVWHSPDYDVPETPATVHYNLGHKAMDGYDVVALNMNALAYGEPWASNCVAGESGNAMGYQISADIVMPDLLDYLKQYEGKPTKIWMAGYSRSGAIGNIIAETLLDEGTIEEKDLYFYAFESPAVIDATAKKPHPSIHNVIDSGDLVTHVFPKAYGLVRAGHDIDIYDSHAKEILEAYDERLVLPKFQPQFASFSNDAEFCNYVIRLLVAKTLTSPDSSNYVPDIHTRADYVNSGVEAYLSYLVGLIMKLPSEGLTAMMDALTANGISLTQEDKIYETARDVLSNFDVEFDDEQLRTACNGLLAFIKTNAAGLALIIAAPSGRSNAMRSFYLHAPEGVLPMLLCYQPK